MKTLRVLETFAAALLSVMACCGPAGPTQASGSEVATRDARPTASATAWSLDDEASYNPPLDAVLAYAETGVPVADPADATLTHCRRLLSALSKQYGVRKKEVHDRVLEVRNYLRSKGIIAGPVSVMGILSRVRWPADQVGNAGALGLPTLPEVTLLYGYLRESGRSDEQALAAIDASVQRSLSKGGPFYDEMLSVARQSAGSH